MNKIVLLSIIGLSAILASCTYTPNSDKSKDTKNSEQVESKEYSSKYICPMHCEGSGSHEPGNCPVCKMDYVLNPDAKLDHDGGRYHCEMHPNEKGHEGDSCPICGMELQPTSNN